MTIQTLINNFRTDINDSTTIFHSDTDILAWVNEAMDYIYEHFKPEPKVTTDSGFTTTTANINYYAYPTDYSTTHKLKIGGVYYEPVDYGTFLNITTGGGNGTAYAVNGSYIYVYPTPSDAYTVVHTYFPKATDLAIGDTFPYSDNIASIVKRFIMSRRYWKLEEYDLSQATLQDFEKRIPDAIYNTLTLPENAIRSASIKI